MTKRSDWQYALHIKGVSSDTLDMGRIGEYLVQFAHLIGHDAKPRFEGMVKGSVVLRTKSSADHPALVRSRLRQAADSEASPMAHKAFNVIGEMMAADGARGAIIDRQKAVVIQFPGVSKPATVEQEVVVTDSGDLDGQVVSIVGADDTVHIRLQDVGGVTHKIVVTKLDLAQELAKRFRKGWLRVRVHGKWKRSPEGRWEPLTVYADSFEELDSTSAADVFRALQQIPDNGWSNLDDPIGEWERLRGIR